MGKARIDIPLDKLAAICRRRAVAVRRALVDLVEERFLSRWLRPYVLAETEVLYGA